MADIQAFSALRYDLAHVGNLSDVVAPPYDVITPEQQRELYGRHPANIVRVILNRAEPGDEPDAHYERAANFIRTWQRHGVMKQDSRAALYIYHQEFELDGAPVTRRGFIARVRLEPFGEGRIFPHEETHSRAKEDRLKLLRATRCNTSQIFTIYADESNDVMQLLESAISDPTPIQATDDAGVVHKMWLVTDSQIISQAAALMGPRDLYIADGHHRYETALNFLAETARQSDVPADHGVNYVSMCCVSMNDPGMVVLPTHRMWRGVPPITSSALADRLGDLASCEVVGHGAEAAPSVWERIQIEDRQAQMAFWCADDDAWLMTELTSAGRERMAELVPGKSDAWRSLGVSILHELIVPHVLGLDGLPAPRYVRAIDEVIEGMQSGDMAGRDATGQEGTAGRFELVTLVMPATIDHVREISQAGERMPAKSTYFYPKLLSGLILNPLG